jgi:CBS domain-containing protein
MQVRDAMTASVERVPPETTVREAANKMKDLDVGALPVYEGDRLIGMVTDRDIVIRAFADGSPTDSMTVHDVMSPGIRYCFEDEGIGEAAKTMRQQKIRRLIVLNREKRLVAKPIGRTRGNGPSARPALFSLSRHAVGVLHVRLLTSEIV